MYIRDLFYVQHALKCLEPLPGLIRWMKCAKDLDLWNGWGEK